MENKVYHGVAEGAFTGALESQTSRIPSSGYLAAAFGASCERTRTLTGA
jgi:hypothetical protein